MHLIQWRAYTVSWLVQIKVVIATSDLRLFIHVSLTPLPAPLQNLALASRIGSKRVIHQPGDSVEKLSGGTGTV